jgi:hypothetical protein
MRLCQKKKQYTPEAQYILIPLWLIFRGIYGGILSCEATEAKLGNFLKTINKNTFAENDPSFSSNFTEIGHF